LVSARFHGFAPYTWFFGAFSALWDLILVFYFATAESTSGASISKRVFNLRVVSKTGSTPTLADAFVRNLSKIYWLLLLLDIIVGLVVSKNYQQKYSDQFVGTTVVPGQGQPAPRWRSQILSLSPNHKSNSALRRC
jgi:uncharacterized RDD family membrane protein YckC